MAIDLHAAHEAGRSLSRAAWNEAWQDHAAGEHIDLPLPDFPAESIQVLTNGKSGAAGIAGAARLSDLVEDEVRERLTTPMENLKLLDYGAGWGRMTRFFLRSFAPANITAVDMDARLADAGHHHLPGIDFRLIESGKPLPFDNDTFDVIFANSVFSHLSEQMHLVTLAELSRVTKPTGLLFIPTLAQKHYEAWLNRDKSRAWISRVLGEEIGVRSRLAAGRFVFGSTGRRAEYGIAVLPESWPAEYWHLAHLDLLATRRDSTQHVQIARPPDVTPKV